jgi:hypothetical protein
MPRLGQTADSPCPARAGALEAERTGVRKEILEWGAGDVSPARRRLFYRGVMAFLVLAVGMAVAGSSGQGCLG